MEVVRNNFVEMITPQLECDAGVKFSSNLMRDDISVGYRLTAEYSQRLKCIEQALQEQRQLLETIASQSYQVVLFDTFILFSSYLCK